MPILAVDQMGRIYETSPDRADGLGYGSSPECVDQQDLTLGSAYLKAQDARREANIRAYRQQQALDAREAHEAELRRQKAQQHARRQEHEERMYQDPALMETMAVEAIRQNMSGMGCACEYKQGISGNVFTANGQSGRAGMSRDQMTLHNAFHGLGSTAHAVDPVEAKQRAHALEAERILRLKARR